MASDVAAAIQQDAYRTQTTRHVEALGWGSIGSFGAVPLSGPIGPVAGGSISSAYWEAMKEHEARVGMAYMAAAGYDVRQAPEAIRQVEERDAEETK